MAACWSARRSLTEFLICNQRAIAGVMDPAGAVIWQGRADRGDLHLDPTPAEALEDLSGSRFAGGGR
jgi:hypothetical protein